MTFLRNFAAPVLAAALFLAVHSACAQAPDAHVAAVLAQMDTASEHFKNARAEFSWDYYEAVVKDTTNQAGSIYFERSKGAMQMGAIVVNPKSHGPEKVLEYKDGVLQMFDESPGIDQIRTLKSGPNQAQYESFLTLGFGGSGADLARAWDIKSLGSETITDDGKPVKTEKLDLVSKNPGVRNMFTHVTIWVDPQRGVSLKQFFDTPSHDHRTAVYTHIVLNGSIDKAKFAIKPGKHTTRV